MKNQLTLSRKSPCNFTVYYYWPH